MILVLWPHLSATNNLETSDIGRQKPCSLLVRRQGAIETRTDPGTLHVRREFRHVGFEDVGFEHKHLSTLDNWSRYWWGVWIRTSMLNPTSWNTTYLNTQKPISATRNLLLNDKHHAGNYTQSYCITVDSSNSYLIMTLTFRPAQRGAQQRGA